MSRQGEDDGDISEEFSGEENEEWDEDISDEDDVVDDDDDEEEEEEGTNQMEETGRSVKQLSKRVIEDEEARDQPPTKSVRTGKSDLYKPPTSEEMNELKETENLFQSSLFRMQIEELVSEVTPKNKKSQALDKILHSLNEIVMKLPKTDSKELTDQSWLPNNVKVPIQQSPYQVKGHFHFAPPTSMKVVGSYLLGFCTKPGMNVDVLLEIPKECLQAKDYLNHRYHRKRALYLACLAAHLDTQDLFTSVVFSFFHQDWNKPVILLTPSGKAGKHYTIRLHACPPEGFFKPSRFHPNKNNIRSDWYTGKGRDQESEPPTPHYNSSILVDMMMTEHLHHLFSLSAEVPAMREGLVLLKVWLHQREMDTGPGCFSGFLMSMLLSYLLSAHKISKVMSSYQIMKNVLQYLANSDWTTQGISLASAVRTEDVPTLSDFHQAHQVVFVDPTGHLNMCADMSTATYARVCHEARLSVAILEDKSLDGFQLLFMQPVPFVHKFDHIFYITHVPRLRLVCEHMSLQDDVMDQCGNYLMAALPSILQLITKALGNRVNLIGVKGYDFGQWSIGDDPPGLKDIGRLTFGLLLNTEFSSSVLDKGPSADQPQAAEFREFWGDRSQLRRFQDGTICEAVVWQGHNMAEKRLVCCQVIQHILNRHANIPQSVIRYVGGHLDSLLSRPNVQESAAVQSQDKLCKSQAQGKKAKKGKNIPQEQPLDPNRNPMSHPGTGDEENVTVMRAYNDLCRIVRGLQDLPLNVTSIQGTSPVFRYAEVFPPRPAQMKKTKHKTVVHGHIQVPVTGQPCPPFVPALKVICHMEGSGKWPEEADAIKRVKAAFHIKLGELLHKQHGLVTSAATGHVDIAMAGFVFRLVIAYHREVNILKLERTAEGLLRERDNETSRQLERDTVMLPKLTSALHGLQQLYSSFSGSLRLARRWVAAQLLDRHVPDVMVDLLVAHVFLHPEPLTPPGSPAVGFLRFLHLLSTHDWKINPLTLNFNRELTAADMQEISNKFTSCRSQLPIMFIATPSDKLTSHWTKTKPTVQILQRLISLSQEALKMLELQILTASEGADFKQVFRPPLDIYDVIIHLDSRNVPRRSEGVDYWKLRDSKDVPIDEGVGQGGKEILPVVEFDPVQLYLEELEDTYGDLALFFHDPCGGLYIAALWKPPAFAAKPFKVTTLNGRSPDLDQSGEDLMMIPNVAAILEDFHSLGKGLVKTVDVKRERPVVR
ncbi:nucleolar protein 6-like [Branchiostoma lanceolatum]|uniref:nucleolar protein 6-like n=1 Tax=Branchiostoma lanceolatum TaxID=7740 RepID=UPI0034543CCA